METRKKSLENNISTANTHSHRYMDSDTPEKRTHLHNETLIRLNKWMADRGLCSRREADQWIDSGWVTVNGKKVYELGVKINPHLDSIKVKGHVVQQKGQSLYILFNKPTGVLTTMDDPKGRPTIADFLSEVPYRVYPVGRLDWDSEGLLLLTNDGEFAQKVMHPSSEVTKTYLVKVDGHPSPEKLNKLRLGVSIVGGKVKAKWVGKVSRGRSKYDWIKIIITEGKNRQIRQMFEKIGFDVLKLQRISIGRLSVQSLKRGKLAFIKPEYAQKVFLPDDPDDLLERKKSYLGRHKKKK